MTNGVYMVFFHKIGNKAILPSFHVIASRDQAKVRAKAWQSTHTVSRKHSKKTKVGNEPILGSLRLCTNYKNYIEKVRNNLKMLKYAIQTQFIGLVTIANGYREFLLNLGHNMTILPEIQYTLDNIGRTASTGC